MKKFILYFVVSLFFSSCTKEKTTTDYKSFSYSGRDWRSKRINQYINNINYIATEVPLRYYLLKEFGDDYRKIDSVYNELKNERIVEFEFQHNEQKDLLLSEFTNKTYEDAVKYMAFNIKKDYQVVTTSGDTVACNGVLFERNFKVAPFKRALLYFGNIPPEENIQLIYQDHLFGNGIIKYNFRETPIKL